MMNRRKLLKALGVTTAAAPLAAKVMADEEMSRLTWLGKPGYLSTGVGIANNMPAGIDEKVGESVPIRMSNYIKLFGVPEHVERETRLRSKYVASLDPDIAIKKSWSMCVKIQHQQQRNYENEIMRYKEMGWHEMAQNKFEAITGFKWRNW